MTVNQEPPSSNQVEGQNNEEQMREEPKEIIFEDDLNVDEEEPVYANDKQEYMHWHYKLNHPSYTERIIFVSNKLFGNILLIFIFLFFIDLILLNIKILFFYRFSVINRLICDFGRFSSWLKSLMMSVWN